MQVTQNQALTSQIYNNIRATVVKDRVGIHVSDLTLCIRKAYWRKMGMQPPATDELCILWMTGYAFQSYMFPAGMELPIIVEGIICTPDLQSGIEVKTTRQSSKRFNLESMAHWNRQILAYCRALGKLDYDLAVLFVCGSYSPPFPSLNCWHIEASQEEVDENWARLKVRKLLLDTALKFGQPPEPNCEDWESGFCECVDLCTDTPCYRKKALKGKL